MTRVLPKELLPYLDRPLIQHILEELAEAGLARVVLVVRPDKDLLRRHLVEPYAPSDRALCPDPVPRGLELQFVQQPQADGLAGAVQAARRELPERFLLVFPDQLLAGPPGAAAQLMAADDGHGSLSALVRVPRPELVYFQGARGLRLRGAGPVFEVEGVLGEEDSLPGGHDEVRAFGRTILEARFLDFLGADPADAAFGLAMQAWLRTGRHRALLLSGSPVDLGTRDGYRHYAAGGSSLPKGELVSRGSRPPL
jgi:UTP--glucose-1-phosphate uridylyltransferase